MNLDRYTCAALMRLGVPHLIKAVYTSPELLDRVPGNLIPKVVIIIIKIRIFLEVERFMYIFDVQVNWILDYIISLSRYQNE